jgi:hypothetical protein
MGFLCGTSPVNTGWITNIVNQMKARIQALINLIRSFIAQVQQLAQQAIAAVSAALAAVRAAIQSVFNKLQALLNAAMSHLQDMIANAFASLQAAFTCSNEQQTKIATQQAASTSDGYAAVLKAQATTTPNTNLPTTTSDLLSLGANAISGAVATAAAAVLAPFTTAFNQIASVFPTLTLPTFSLTFPTIS